MPASKSKAKTKTKKTRAPRGGRSLVKAAKGEAMCLAGIKSGKNAGKECERPAGYGTDHPGLGRCNLHGGNLPAHIKHQANAELSLLVEEPVHMDPNEALLWCVSLAAQDVRWINFQIASIEEHEHIVAPVKEATETGESPQGEVDKTITTKEPARLHFLIKERFSAEERLARYSKMALDAGVAERLVKMAEQMAGLIAPLLNEVLEHFNIDPSEARPVIEKHMRTLEGTTVGAPRLAA